jgi:hypothetical protein
MIIVVVVLERECNIVKNIEYLTRSNDSGYSICICSFPLASCFSIYFWVLEYDEFVYICFGMLISWFLYSNFGIIVFLTPKNRIDKRNMKVLYVLFLLLLLVVSVGLIVWFVWPVENKQSTDISSVDKEYRCLLQRVSTLLSEYDIKYFVFGKTLSDLRNNRYLGDQLCIAVDDCYRDIIEALEKHHIKNDFSISTDVFQLSYAKELFTMKNRDVSARVNFYKLDNGMVKFDKYGIEMDAVFPIQVEVMDGLAVMMPSRSVFSVSKK